jgi:hypothetical protein
MSKEILKVGSLAAKSGEKCFGINEYLVERRPYRLPTWLINGSADGPTLVVTAGVHDAEVPRFAPLPAPAFQPFCRKPVVKVSGRLGMLRCIPTGCAA